MILRLTKKMIVAITSVLLITIGTAFATPSSQLNKTKQLYNDAVKKVEALEREVEKLDTQIVDTMLEIETIDKKVNDSKAAIVKTEGEIKTIETNIKEEEKLFGERMEALYINGVTSYLDVVLEATSFSDFISRIDTVKTIIEYDNQIMNGLNTQKATLANKKQGLEKEQANLVALQTESKNKLATLNKKKQEQGTIIADLESKQKLYASQIREYQAAIEQSYAEQAQSSAASNNSSPSKPNTSGTTNKPGNSSKPSKPGTSTGGGQSEADVPNRGDGSASGMEIVNYAKRFLGTPYVWGGTTPAGFDCSGFTSYVYRNAAGISIPRTSGSQANVGQYIGSKGSLQPGDLVFFGSPTSHVGIYVGGGQYIHSPRTGDVVKISPLTRKDFTHGRRLL